MPTRKGRLAGQERDPGIASMGPRRCRRGRAASSGQHLSVGALQWGRVVADAEGESPGTLRELEIALQWGRVVADAEGRRDQDGKHGEHASMGPRRCRRGRRKSTARPRRPPGRGFNGAASLPTRKDDAAASQDVLPWECFNGAASLPTRKDAALQHANTVTPASMGPRRCRRGRGLASCCSTRCATCFNGAASLPTRKAGGGRGPSGSTPASMGPRRCRRGRGRGWGVQVGGEPRGFNGAASLPTRKAELAETIREESAASMGPRRCRRGRRRPHVGDLVALDASMGPRRCRRGRTRRWVMGSC